METSNTTPLGRINALLAAGYEVDPSGIRADSDAVWLAHPGGNHPQHPPLIAYANGLVVGTAKDDGSQLRFPPESEARFAEFVRAVPKPHPFTVRARIPVWALAILGAVLLTLLLV